MAKSTSTRITKMSPSSPYNLRHSPTRSLKARTLSTYLTTARHRAKQSTPRTKRRLALEVNATWSRAHDSEIGFEMGMLANELVSGGRPPEWYIARHQQDLFREWEESMGILNGEFEKGLEVMSWLGGAVVEAPAVKVVFGAVDMRGLIQGRSMTAKRIDGREVGPERLPEVQEMSWREWRKFSRECNLLLEAVDGVPWGWHMSDREWEEFSRAEGRFRHDLSRDSSQIRRLRVWEGCDEEEDEWDLERFEDELPEV